LSLRDSTTIHSSIKRPRVEAAMARRRKKILDAAVDLFQQKGYLATTVDDIAARAGITKRTLYHHMGHKETILSEIHSRFIEEGLERWEAVSREGGTATEMLRRLIGEHIRIVAEHRNEIAVFFEEAKHLDPADRHNINLQRDRYAAILRDTIEMGMATGEFDPDLDVQLTTLLILGSLTEVYRWYGGRTKGSVESLIRLCTEMALAGISREDPC
jgi:AcrR family transcriptional regulator